MGLQAGLQVGLHHRVRPPVSPSVPAIFSISDKVTIKAALLVNIVHLLSRCQLAYQTKDLQQATSSWAGLTLRNETIVSLKDRFRHAQVTE